MRDAGESATEKGGGIAPAPKREETEGAESARRNGGEGGTGEGETPTVIGEADSNRGNRPASWQEAEEQDAFNPERAEDGDARLTWSRAGEKGGGREARGDTGAATTTPGSWSRQGTKRLLGRPHRGDPGARRRVGIESHDELVTLEALVREAFEVPHEGDVILPTFPSLELTDVHPFLRNFT